VLQRAHREEGVRLSGPGGRDKRRYDRVRITHSRNVFNLSEGGAYIATEKPRRLGSLFYFEYHPGKGDEPILALAKVIRVLHRPNPRLKEPAGMAVQFVKMEEADLARLRNYLEVCRLKARQEPGSGRVSDD